MNLEQLLLNGKLKNTLIDTKNYAGYPAFFYNSTLNFCSEKIDSKKLNKKLA